MQYTHVRNKNSNTQGSSPYMVNVIFHTLKNRSLRKEVASSGRSSHFGKGCNCSESLLDTVVSI